MISSRNGRTAERMGSCAAMLPGKVKSSFSLRLPLSASGANLRASQTPTATKNTAKAPMRKSGVGKPVSVSGILKISAPVAARVSRSTASTESSEAVSTASPIASKSTSSTTGQTTNEISVSLKIGISTSTSASGGKSWLCQGVALTPRRRCSHTGNTECRMASTR